MRGSVVALVLVFSVAACRDDGALDPSAAHFEGIDPEVVREVVASDVVRENMAPSLNDPNLAQGITLNFIVCRDVARVYEGWRETGKLPALALLPNPTNPEDSYSTWKATYRQLERWHDEGNRALLRQWVTRPTGCGEWIPAEPGSDDGATVGEAIRANDPPPSATPENQ